MKRTRGIFAVCLIMVLCLFTGCAKSGPDVTLDTILSEIETEFGLDAASRMSDMDLLDLYGIQASDLAEQASLTSMNGIFPDEIIMIKAKDEDALSRIQDKLENRLQEVLNQSRSYDAESYAVAQKCRVDVNGLYIALFVSANHEKMSEIYHSHF